MIALGLLVILPSTATAYEPENSMPKSPRITLVVNEDLKQLEGDLEKGQASLVTPHGELVVAVKEVDLFSPNGREIWQESPRGEPQLVGYAETRTFQGFVQGDQQSRVILTTDLRTFSVLGSILHEGQRFLIDSRPLDGRRVAMTYSWDTRLEGSPVQGADIQSHGVDTYIRVFSDPAFRNAHSNWQTRITNAFNEQYWMWDQDVDIDQHHGPFWSVSQNWSTNCNSHLTAFESYVAARSFPEDAFQHFTGVDLSGCYGVANSDAVLGTWEATSIVEAVDHSLWDSYDPDESHNLGILSATELGHVYGEEDHPQDQRCEAYFLGACTDWSYNVMAGGQEIDERGFWFTVQSQNRIWNGGRAQL